MVFFRHPTAFTKTKKHFSKGFIVLIIIVILFSGLFFLYIPVKVVSSDNSIFTNGRIYFSEKISYLFHQPKVGDPVCFTVKDNFDFQHIGLITKITNDEQKTFYTIINRNNSNNPRVVTRDRIISRVYYPLLNIPTPYSDFIIVPTPTPTLTSTYIPYPEPSIENKTTYYNQVSISGFTLNLPLDWKINTINSVDGAIIITQKSPYQIKLMLKIVKVKPTMVIFGDQLLGITEDNGQIYEETGIGGAVFTPYLVRYTNGDIYNFQWDLESTQPDPLNGDMWRPDTNFSQNDLLKIVQTAFKNN